jgi:hypothetical protein
LGIGTNIDLLENRVCSGHFYYLFVKFTHHERIKTNNRCCFYLSQPVFATVFAIGLGKDELNLVKILSAILIFVGVYLVTSSPKALREKNRLHMKKLCTTNFYIINK